jgi:hypothetical protein
MRDISIHRNLFELLLTLGFRPEERRSKLLLNSVECAQPGNPENAARKWMHFAEWCVPIESGLTDVQHLFTKQGFMRAMFYSKFFVYPVLPDSPSLLHTLLMGIVLGRDEVSFSPQVLRTMRPEGILMLVFRVLTVLKRDE